MIASLVALLAALVASATAVPATANATMFAHRLTPPPFVAGPRWSDSHTAAAAPDHALAARAGGVPRWVVYSDAWIGGESGPPAMSSVNGFSVFVISFLLSGGPADQAVEWVNIGAAAQQSIKAAYNAAGIKLMVSAFGATDFPTSAGREPIATANTMAQFVLDNHLDGIDVDYEDFGAINAQDGRAESWLESFTKQLRTKLPQGQYLLTHAPVAPWLNGALYRTGAYGAVNAAVGNLIDWYNIQFYNQGTSEYTTCIGLLTQSSATWPNSALFQIAAGGFDLDKLVIGKPGAPAGDANNGYIDPLSLAQCVQQAKAQGWAAGVSAWQFPHADTAWITTVRSLAWPVSGASPPPTTTPPPGAGCGGAPAWSASATYTANARVSFGGHLWTAQWWTQGDAPGTTNSGAAVWKDNGAC